MEHDPVSWLVDGGDLLHPGIEVGDGFLVQTARGMGARRAATTLGPRVNAANRGGGSGGDFFDGVEDRRLEAGAGKASPQEVLQLFVGQVEVKGVGHGGEGSTGWLRRAWGCGEPASLGSHPWQRLDFLVRLNCVKNRLIPS